MKKIIILPIVAILIFLTGCQKNENSQTRFLLNTVCTITAECRDETLAGAFSVAKNYENLFSRTIKGSEIYKLNLGENISVSDDTLYIINRAKEFSKISNGKFDITICSVSELWDFENKIIPNVLEVQNALKTVNYENIKINETTVSLGGSKIDLGGIAKGFIADKMKDYLKENNVKSGLINLGGNIITFGQDSVVGIKRPFSEDTIATIKLRDKSIVTSGIYERYIEKDNVFYHHILDTKTGFSVENNLASVTVIGKSSLDCDALSTVCMVLGLDEGLAVIENLPDYEAVFIDKNERITLSSGLKFNGNEIYFR